MITQHCTFPSMMKTVPHNPFSKGSGNVGTVTVDPVTRYLLRGTERQSLRIVWLVICCEELTVSHCESCDSLFAARN
ncbi:hypothetical protein RRG08_032411 [Elysia crispata]|uniref:Uncharacterized protein n=1 Tax=Elysia crispata TaxID=231223 RepID=A0AAE1CJS9_9GAST|nr:hypothetical protein RRG08_032411 [Elysia crispata]